MSHQEELFVFALGVASYFAIALLVSYFRKYTNIYSLLAIAGSILPVGLSVTILLTLVGYGAIAFFGDYPLFKNLFSCYITGFMFTAAPALVALIFTPHPKESSRLAKVVFTLLNTLREIFIDFVSNEIARDFRYRRFKIVTSQSENQYRALNKLFEQNKTQIAIRYRDKAKSMTPKKAFGIFQIRNIYVKNGYLLEYFGYKRYLRLIKEINATPDIFMNGWDCVERRGRDSVDEAAKGQERRFYNQPRFREAFLSRLQIPLD